MCRTIRGVFNKRSDNIYIYKYKYTDIDIDIDNIEVCAS